MSDLKNILKPGTAVYESMYGKTGYIVRYVDTSKQEMFLIDFQPGGMKKIMGQYVVVWESNEEEGGLCLSMDVPEQAAQKDFELAQQLKISSIDNVEDLEKQALEQREQRHQQQQKEFEERKAKTKAFDEKYIPMVPAWAKSVLVASHVIDESDLMTDYHASRSDRVIILGFSKHTRDLFPEMRQAALNHEETKHLFNAPESANHREKYSMGSGYYLKESYRHDTGWRVYKHVFWDGKVSLPEGEWSVPDKAATVETSETLTAGIEEHTHTKKNIQMFLVILSEKVEKEIFNSLRDNCKARGGWYSRAWSQTPGGFAFLDLETAETFKKDFKL